MLAGWGNRGRHWWRAHLHPRQHESGHVTRAVLVQNKAWAEFGELLWINPDLCLPRYNWGNHEIFWATIMVNSSWDNADWIWNYELLLYLKATINIVGSHDDAPLPLNQCWCELVVVTYCVQLIFQHWFWGGGIDIVPTLFTMIVVNCSLEDITV